MNNMDPQQSMSILASTVVEKQIRVPKRVLREKQVERTITIPETVMVEEIVDTTEVVTERVIEVAVPIFTTKVVEIPEIEYVEKTVEVPEVQYVEVIKTVPRKVVEEVVRPVHVTKTVEKEVEVPYMEYIDVPVEKIVEVPNYIENITYNEVKVPQVKEVLVPVDKTIVQEVQVARKIPVPIEAHTKYKYEMPTLRPNYKRKELAIYAPRFVEVPIPAELMDEEAQRVANHMREQVHILANLEAPALAEIEKIAAYSKQIDFHAHISKSHYHAAIEKAWRDKKLTVDHSMAHQNVQLA